MAIPLSKKNVSAEESGNYELPMSSYIWFSAPHIVSSWLVAPLYLIQGIYAKYYGVSLITLASIILVARLFDAISDPVIGYCSDRYYQRNQTRKPFIFWGGLMLIVSSYFLYVPKVFVSGSPGEGGHINIWYFSIWFMVFYLSYTVMEIPHTAWASDITKTSSDKSKIYSVRGITGYLGLILFYAIPLLPFFETNDITPETLEFSVIAASVAMIPLMLLCIKNTPSRSYGSFDGISASIDENRKVSLKRNFRVVISSVVDNKPALLFFAAYLFGGLSVGMWQGLIFLYVDSYLGLGSQFVEMFLVAFFIGLFAVPIWCKLSITFGKKQILVCGLVFQISSFILTGALSPDEVDLWQLVVLKVVNTFGNACTMAIAPAMLSEIVDYGIWKFREENTATYYSLHAFITKVNGGVGAALGLLIAGWYGFDATRTVQSLEGVSGLILSMVWLPVFFSTAALILIVLNPINSARYAIVRRSLARRYSSEKN